MTYLYWYLGIGLFYTFGAFLYAVYAIKIFPNSNKHLTKWILLKRSILILFCWPYFIIKYRGY